MEKFINYVVVTKIMVTVKGRDFKLHSNGDLELITDKTKIEKGHIGVFGVRLPSDKFYVLGIGGIARCYPNTYVLKDGESKLELWLADCVHMPYEQQPF